jgi:hypothetical protein
MQPVEAVPVPLTRIYTILRHGAMIASTCLAMNLNRRVFVARACERTSLVRQTRYDSVP